MKTSFWGQNTEMFDGKQVDFPIVVAIWLNHLGIGKVQSE